MTVAELIAALQNAPQDASVIKQFERLRTAGVAEVPPGSGLYIIALRCDGGGRAGDLSQLPERLRLLASRIEAGRSLTGTPAGGVGSGIARNPL